MSIRSRLLLLVFAVWLPAAAGFTLLGRATYEREARAAHERVEQLAAALGLLVERELDKRAVLAQALAASAAVQEGDLARFHRDATAATAAIASWALLVDSEKQLVNTRLPLAEAGTVSRMEGAPMVSDSPQVFFAAQGPISMKPVMAVFAPSPGARQPRLNTAVAFDPSVIQDLVERQPFPDGSLVAILDREQRVMARSRDPARWLGTHATGDVLRRARSGEPGFMPSITLDGVPSLSYLSAANRYGWRVVIAMPQAALAEAARRVTLQAFVAAGSLLLIGLAVALFGARRISRPVAALRGAARILENGGVPPLLATGMAESDAVGKVLHSAGVRSHEATRILEERVADAVRLAQEAQAKLLNAQKHEAIGRLTAGISHDFNNLLQTIVTALHVLDRQVSDGPAKRVLQGAVRASSKAADLIRQMSTFGRSQSLVPRPVNLGDLVLKSRELTGKAVGEKVVLSASIEQDLPCVFVDPNQLELALLNVIFNARDAMPDGGNIVISARLASAQEEAEVGASPLVCLEVADDGQGMSEEVRNRAFEPYFTTKPVGHGSGLGLSHAQAFARQSGGDARLASEPGKGTCVSFYLPATREAPAAVEPTREEPLAARALSILMVEDDLLVSSVVVPALESAGHQVTLAVTVDEALAILDRGLQVDVLFTDVVMPGKLSGMDLVAWCRRHRPDLPTVVATGYSAQQGEDAYAVLRKPYGIDQLLRVLQAAVSVDRSVLPARPQSS